MLNTTSTFPSDLGISTRVGLTRGVGGITSFAEAQTRYREELLQARRDRHRAHAGKRWTGVTRWTPWPSSDQRRRSSRARRNSTACAN